GPTGHCKLERPPHVRHIESDVHDAVAVRDEPLALRVLLRQWRGQHERDLALLEHVARLVPHLRFEARIGQHVEAEGVAVEERALASVAHKEADVIDLAKGDIGRGHGVPRYRSNWA